MKIVELNEELMPDYLCCLEEWSDEFKEAGDHKACWTEKMLARGLRVFFALDDQGVAGGMIQALPIEQSFVLGQDLYMVLCIWVHPHQKKGRGNFRKQGMGRALLAAAEEDAKSRGALGMAAWGLSLPFWMKASWFKKYGYQKAQSQGFLGPVLLFKPFSPEAQPPKWPHPQPGPEPIEGKVRVTALCSGWCPIMGMTFERAKRAASELGDRVVFEGIITDEPEVQAQWGLADDLRIDGKSIGQGPPLSYDKIKKQIAKRVKKLA